MKFLLLLIPFSLIGFLLFKKKAGAAPAPTLTERLIAAGVDPDIFRALTAQEQSDLLAEVEAGTASPTETQAATLEDFPIIASQLFDQAPTRGPEDIPDAQLGTGEFIKEDPTEFSSGAFMA